MGEPEGVSRELSGNDWHQGCSLAPFQAFCLTGDCLISFLGASDFPMDQTSLLGSWVQPVLRDVPSPSHGVHVFIPRALAGAKSFLTLPACPVTSGNSRVWQLTISSQTGELTAAPNRVTQVCTSLGTGCSPPTLQRPICTTNQTTLPTTLQPLCTV